MRTRIKICGITTLDDALAAVAAGADALGFMFYSGSRRNIEPKKAAEIIHALPPFVARVGVFVNASRETVREIAATCGLDTLQFHGEETPDFCREFTPLKVYKAFRIQDANSLNPLGEYRTDAWLLDSHVSGQLGGTGARFNWDLALKAKALGYPIILAGGLTPENVREAVQKVRPYAVDVSSGVETEPGLKDRRKMEAFVNAVRAAG